MQGSALPSIVSLDDYRRARHGRTDARPMPTTASSGTQSPRPMWVYWVPVWIW